jgi:predicted dehydrogenase
MTKRREFIRKSALGTAGFAIGGMGFTAKSYASVIGANDRINVAVVGLRSRGNAHIEEWCSLTDKYNIRVAAICDADEQFLPGCSEDVAELTGNRPVSEWDIRKIIDNKEIDVVSYATPNHWHALGTIWACQAGKHVYVEKPASHNIFEGRKMVEAARKYNVRVQVGFQGRSYKNVIEAINFMHQGGIGDVYMARGLCFKPRDSFGIASDSEPPGSLHFDRWLGPAPMRRYNEKKGHYNWHWFWDTGNGDSGNQGVHEFDIARWGLNKHEHPVSVCSTGGIFGISPDECAQETPNTQSSLFEYKDGKILEFETRGRYCNSEGTMELTIGNIFCGNEGYLEIDCWKTLGGEWRAFRQRDKVPFAGSEGAGMGQEDPDLEGPDSTAHFTNFVAGLKSGEDSLLNSDIEEEVMSSALPHLGNISYRLGRQLYFDGASEKFADDPEADTYLTREYRAPYVVPDEI